MLIANNPVVTLRPVESVTVPCMDTWITFRQASADLAIVVYYHPWPFVFLNSRHFFRFVSRTVSPGVTIWEKQPSQIIEKEFDEEMRENPQAMHAFTD